MQSSEFSWEKMKGIREKIERARIEIIEKAREKLREN